MAEQQRIMPPYGDIFLTSTPTLDKLSQQLYAEQQMRTQLKIKENQALDAGIQKEIGKVRSVDTPEVIQSYNNYKQLKKQLLFDKNLQKDPLAYNQAQQAANQAYQDIFTKANQSAEVKEMAKTMTTDRFKNPDAYADDYGQRVATLMNTPLSGLQQHQQYGDLTNWDQYRYQGSNTDFAKNVKDAMGQPRQVYTSSKVLDGGLQTQLTPYHFGNAPAQVYENLIGSFAMHRTGRDASLQWDKIPQAQIEATVQKYQQIPKEKWEKMGLPAPQDLGQFSDNKADNYAKYLAMNYAINNEPKEGAPVFRENKKAVLDWQLNKDKIMEGIRHGNREDEIRLRDNLKDKNDTEQNDAIDDLYDGLKVDAIKDRRPYKSSTGQSSDQYTMKATEGVKKLFATHDSKGHLVYPDELRFSKDFSTVIPTYFEHYTDDKGNRLPEVVKSDNGDTKVINDLSKPIMESEFKERWKKELMGAGAYGKSLNKKSATKKNHPLPAGKPRQVTQGGHNYEWSEETGSYE